MNQREPRDIDRNRQTQGEKYENNGRKFIFSKSFTSSSTRMICRSNPDKPGTEICTTTTTRSVYNPQTRKNETVREKKEEIRKSGLPKNLMITLSSSKPSPIVRPIPTERKFSVLDFFFGRDKYAPRNKKINLGDIPKVFEKQGREYLDSILQSIDAKYDHQQGEDHPEMRPIDVTQKYFDNYFDNIQPKETNIPQSKEHNRIPTNKISSQLNHMDYYTILELKRTCTQEDIQKAYRKLALKYHPAKNTGEMEAYAYHFANIAEAYEVLSNPTNKGLFDQFGEKVLKEGLPHAANVPAPVYRFNGNALQIFESFFGSSNPFSEPIDDTGYDLEGSMFGGAYGGSGVKMSPPPENIIVIINCTLEEFYNGCMKQMGYDKQILALDGKSTKLLRITKEIEVKPGYGEETVLRYQNEGNDSYAHNPSDLLIKFKLEKHSKYQRKGNDLIYTYKLSLQDALCSYPIHIETLDQRELSISMDEVISPNTTKLVPKEGMPIDINDPLALLRNSYEKGNLYIKFDIIFPEFLDIQQKMDIKKILKQQTLLFESQKYYS